MEVKKSEVQQQKLSHIQEQALKADHDLFIKARDVRDSSHDEFDGMTLSEHVESNAKLACSFIPPRKNSSDVSIVTGSPREKLLTIVANIFKLNLEPTAKAISKITETTDLEVGRIGTYSLKKSNLLDKDEEKKLLRGLYLGEQGTVLIREEWVPRTKKRKRTNGKTTFDPKKGTVVQSKIEELTHYNCERKLIDLLSFYPGNIKQLDLDKQPFVFTRELGNYKELEAIFSKWENWKFVKPGNKALFGDTGVDSVPYRDFRLYKLEQDQIEIIKKYDIWEDEFQIYLNGVMMLPVGFPLPYEWVGEEDEGKCYPFTHQVLEPISPFFFYGKSLMSKLRVHSELQDEMLKMMVHKTKQSIKPPMGNMTGNTLSPRIFDPGTLWDGVDPKKLSRIIDHQGVTASEYNFYSLLKNNIDALTVSPTFQGQAPDKQATATQIVTQQRQAQENLTITLFSVRRMEEKVNYLRLQNILENWTKPIDTKVEGKEIHPVYRSIEVDDVNLGDKTGKAIIRMTDQTPTNEERSKKSYELLTEKRRAKKPMEEMMLSIPLLKKNKYYWQISVNPTPRESDDLNKVLFSDKMTQAMNFFGAQSMNMDFWKKNFATIWGDKPEEVFLPSSTEDLNNMMMQKRNTEEMMGSSKSGQDLKKAVNPSLNQLVGKV